MPAAPAIDFSRLIHFAGFGGSDTGIENRGMHHSLISGGYEQADKDLVQPGIKAGAKRVLCHSIRGTTGDRMDWDTWLLPTTAKRASPQRFVKTFKPYRGKVEVIAYLGPPHGSDTFKGLSTYKLFERLWKSVEPILDAHCSLMVDSLQDVEAGSVWESFLRTVQQAMRSYGGTLYGESKVYYDKQAPHWKDVPGLSAWNWNTIPAEAFPWMATRESELILQPQIPIGEDETTPSLRRWLPVLVADAQQVGTVATNVGWLAEVMK